MAKRKAKITLLSEFLDEFEQEHASGYGHLPSGWLDSFQLLGSAQKTALMNLIGKKIHKLYLLEKKEKEL